MSHELPHEGVPHCHRRVPRLLGRAHPAAGLVLRPGQVVKLSVPQCHPVLGHHHKEGVSFMAPRQTNDEYLASLEAELKATKAKAEETIAAKIAAVQAKLDAAKAKDEERTKSRIVKLDEQIAAAKVSITKAEARLAKLQEERANLIGTTEEPDSNPELVDDERTEQPEATAKGSRRRADAA